MIRTMIAALLAATTMATPAMAQTRYFARERIAGLSPNSAVTYAPIYSDTLGACTAGTQSKPIIGCKASDGTSADLSKCSSFPQSTGATSCTMGITCEPLSGSKYPALKAGATGNMKLADNVTSPAAAQTYCDAKAKTATEPAYCGHGASTSQVWWYPKSVSTLNSYPSSPKLYAADCS